MRKILALVLAVLSIVSLLAVSGCQAQTYELALITDLGTIDDKSFNQGCWEGVVQYAEENNITHQYYKPAEGSDAAYEAAIDLAVKGGAKVVVTPGYLFSVAVGVCQEKYPDVKFIIVDAAPDTIASNTYSILYAEEQAGFMAGYAAVKDGFTDLGFQGGLAVPAVVRYGYGFAQGADYAAQELGVKVTMKYNYSGDFDATPENQARAAAWYADGCQIIFGCGGSVGNSVMAAAGDDQWVIGVDVDQYAESDKVISSAMKELGKSVYDAIAAYYNGAFPGGTQANLTAAEGGVGIAMDNAKWRTYTQADADALEAKLVAGEITILKDTDAATAADLNLKNVTITIVE